MVFTRATGKHRRPGRMHRTTARAAGVAALAGTGAVGTLVSPVFAAGAPAAEDTGLNPVISIGDTIAEQINAQAAAQRRAAEQKTAAEQARKERAAEARAAREAERKRFNAFVPPVSGSYVSTGYRTGGSLWSSGAHTGIDFHAMSGTAVHAVGAGTVVRTGWGGAYGNQIVIRMADGMYTQYGHLSSVDVLVGQKVTPGQRIGRSGATGNATGPHLHFEARTTPEYGSDVDPVAYLREHGVHC
jgi:murein DD-endopeptidase MepM/ murein hydrolase activator NlpD